MLYVESCHSVAFTTESVMNEFVLSRTLSTWGWKSQRPPWLAAGGGEPTLGFRVSATAIGL